ncbi:hypothetical protein Bbelb_373010 [Branchiostoma belcheri]|nr:hypothetical protein Bbelb_373010 [Branchiostoma belcheri]
MRAHNPIVSDIPVRYKCAYSDTNPSHEKARGQESAHPPANVAECWFTHTESIRKLYGKKGFLKLESHLKRGLIGMFSVLAPAGIMKPSLRRLRLLQGPWRGWNGGGGDPDGSQACTPLVGMVPARPRVGSPEGRREIRSAGGQGPRNIWKARAVPLVITRAGTPVSNVIAAQDPARDLTAARSNCKSRSAPYRKPHGSRRETDRAPDGSLTETGRQGDQKNVAHDRVVSSHGPKTLVTCPGDFVIWVTDVSCRKSNSMLKWYRTGHGAYDQEVSADNSARLALSYIKQGLIAHSLCAFTENIPPDRSELQRRGGLPSDQHDSVSTRKEARSGDRSAWGRTARILADQFGQAGIGYLSGVSGLAGSPLGPLAVRGFSSRYGGDSLGYDATSTKTTYRGSAGCRAAGSETSGSSTAGYPSSSPVRSSVRQPQQQGGLVVWCELPRAVIVTTKLPTEDMRKWTTTTWTATNNDAVPASTASSSTATTSAGHTAPSSTTSAERTATGSTALAANRLRDIGRAEGSRDIPDRALCRHFVFADTFGRTTSTSAFTSCMLCSSLSLLECSLAHSGRGSRAVKHTSRAV